MDKDNKENRLLKLENPTLHEEDSGDELPLDSENVDSDELEETFLDHVISFDILPCDENGVKDISEPASAIMSKALEILLSKYEDYGPSTITRNMDMKVDANKKKVLQSILTRSFDKIYRIENLLDKNKFNHESLEDSAIDLINYMVIFLLVKFGEWE